MTARLSSTPRKPLAHEQVPGYTGYTYQSGAAADQRRLSTMCPACSAVVRLTPDTYLAQHQTSPAPHARMLQHDNGWGEVCIMSHRAAPAWDEPTTRAAAKGRSMEVCEFCRRQAATDMHHRISRGVGGKWHPANIIHLCRGCHHKATVYRDWAYLVGLVVLSHEDPAAKPVERPIGLLWLTDEVTGGLSEEATVPARRTRARQIPRRKDPWPKRRLRG